MSDYIPASIRRLVIRRAQDRCEYCGLAQQGQEATFHIDHIVPVKSGGLTEPSNLALACVSCSLRKSAKETALDPVTNQVVSLFHPRRQLWQEHFRWQGVRIVGSTPIGRATVEALKMNRHVILAIREEDATLGRHPPPVLQSLDGL